MLATLCRRPKLLVGLVAIVVTISASLMAPVVYAHLNVTPGAHAGWCVGNGPAQANTSGVSLPTGPHDSTISGAYAAMCGGLSNTASGDYASVVGGFTNVASGDDSTVAGGDSNEASGDNASAGGGHHNKASGGSATVPGGAYNTASGTRSFAAGYRAKAQHSGAFVWADNHTADFKSTRSNEFSVRATGGVRIVTDINSSGAPTAGVRLAPGSGSWSTLSDRNAKANFAVVDGRAVLEQLASIPIQAWNYKSQDASIRHIGPTAQDFAAAFNVGEDSATISTVDADGVALAAIQGLYQENQALKARVVTLEQTGAAARPASLGGVSPWVLLALVVGAVNLVLLLVVVALLVRRRGVPVPSV